MIYETSRWEPHGPVCLLYMSYISLCL
jgi:hypothetical protein